MRKKWTGNKTSAKKEWDCLGVLTDRASDRMTVIDGRTFRTEIFVAKVAVETRERGFPGDDHRDGLTVYQCVNY
jgi:hypothetical protein